MDIPLEAEKSLRSLTSFHKRYILTQVENQQLVFPTQWVAEIILVERSQLLNLPFYNSMFLGVIHHQGSIIPLITLDAVNQEGQNQVVQQNRMQETLKAIRLSQFVSGLSGVGIIVDQVIGSICPEQLLATEQKTTGSLNPAIQVFQPERIPPSIWQPQ